MTDTPTTEALKPCPFCGGDAKRFTLDDGDNAGGDVIQCMGVCGASSHVEFGRKENLVSLWNTRAGASGERETLEQAQFLCDRLDQLEWVEDDLLNTVDDFFGHVAPALSRLKATLSRLTRSEADEAPGVSAAVQKLRKAYERVQEAKQSGKAGIQPIWDAINAIPAALGDLEGGNPGLNEKGLRSRLLGHAADLRDQEWDEDNAASADVEEAVRRLSNLPAHPAPGVEIPAGMDTAPTDGTMVRLLVDYTNGGAALEDATRAWTIGFNNLGNTGEDRWQFAGWCWTHDHFTHGTGTPVGWLPWSNPSTGGDD